MEREFDNPKPLPAMTKEVRSLVEAISEAVRADEIAEGCDISAGMFGPAFSQLVHGLAEAERKARAFDMITELMGYVQNGTDGIVTLFQDDATMSYWISHRTAGKTNPDWQEYGTSLQAAIKLAYEKHGDE